MKPLCTSERKYGKLCLTIWMNGEHMIPATGHEEALFLLYANRRTAVRSVENLVKKYASRVTTLKKITPHKLRSTYGTTLYQETGDIYLVASAPGHKDVNTTRKHYANMDEERRRQAANVVKLKSETQLPSSRVQKTNPPYGWISF